MTTPDPGFAFAANVATFENGMIFFETGKDFGDLEFVKGAEETEILNGSLKISFNIGIEIRFKLEAFGILVINLSGGKFRVARASEIGFVGARFVGDDDVFFAGEIGDKIGNEGE